MILAYEKGKSFETNEVSFFSPIKLLKLHTTSMQCENQICNACCCSEHIWQAPYHSTAEERSLYERGVIHLVLSWSLALPDGRLVKTDKSLKCAYSFFRGY